MIFLYVFLALLALLIFLLFVNIHIVFAYQNKSTVTIRVLFLKFDGMKLFSHLTRQSESTNQIAEQSGKTTRKTKKIDPLGFVEFLMRITKIIAFFVKENLSKMRIHLKELFVLVGTDDAAKTAILYGGAVQAANYLCALLQRTSHFRFNHRNLVISPDFTSEKSRFTIHLDLTVKAFHLINIFMRSYFRLFEGKEENHARNSVKTSHRRIP